MQAIVTKYHPATNMRGSRISAKCDAGRISIPYPHEVGWGEQAHRVAADALVQKLGWNNEHYGDMAGGALPQASGGYVFVFPKGSETYNPSRYSAR